MGFFLYNSPNIHPIDQISVGVAYKSVPNNIYGALYQSVTI